MGRGHRLQDFLASGVLRRFRSPRSMGLKAVRGRGGQRWHRRRPGPGPPSRTCLWKPWARARAAKPRREWAAFLPSALHPPRRGAPGRAPPSRVVFPTHSSDWGWGPSPRTPPPGPARCPTSGSAGLAPLPARLRRAGRTSDPPARPGGGRRSPRAQRPRPFPALRAPPLVCRGLRSQRHAGPGSSPPGGSGPLPPPGTLITHMLMCPGHTSGHPWVLLGCTVCPSSTTVPCPQVNLACSKWGLS